MMVVVMLVDGDEMQVLVQVLQHMCTKGNTS